MSDAELMHVTVGQHYPDGLGQGEVRELCALAFELADGTARAIIQTRSNKSPGGWYDGTPKNNTDAASLHGAMRYLQLRGPNLVGYRVRFMNDRFRFEDIP